MRHALATALLTFASTLLGRSRREWALAMEGEFEAAISDGGQLSFACGCLLTAIKELPHHAEGRLALANQTLASGILVPIAGLQFLCAVGMIAPFSPTGGSEGFPVPGSMQALFFLNACLAAEPVRLCLWMLLGISNLRLAWSLLDGNWIGVVRAAALAIAVTLTGIIFDAVLMLVDGRALLQAAVLLIELAAITMSARFDPHQITPDVA